MLTLAHFGKPIALPFSQKVNFLFIGSSHGTLDDERLYLCTLLHGLN